METGSYTFDHFEHQAKEVERLNFQAKINLEREEAFLIQSGLTSGMRVLDLGCGTGESTKLLASIADNGIVTGVDSNPNLLECALEKSTPNIQFQLGDLYNLEYPKNSFNFIYSRFVFQHLDSPLDALKEVFQLLKPGGRIVLLDVDDGYFNFNPQSNGLENFLAQVENAQVAKGGDRRVGHKLKAYLADCSFVNIIEIQETISSCDIGIKKFLDVTTGLKLEHLSNEKKDQARDDLKQIYHDAIKNNARGELTLFGTIGVKPKISMI